MVLQLKDGLFMNHCGIARRQFVSYKSDDRQHDRERELNMLAAHSVHTKLLHGGIWAVFHGLKRSAQITSVGPVPDLFFATRGQR